METIRTQHIFIINIQFDRPAGYLLLAYLDGENLVIGESQFFHGNHIPVPGTERAAFFQHHFRLQFDSLRIGSFGYLLIREFQSDFVNIKPDISTVTDRKINKKILPAGIYCSTAYAIGFHGN